MKFGGTSMAGTERIRTVAKLVAREVANGNEVAVVVSAMAGETDRLVNFCREANPRYDPAEYDVVVAAGEQVTSGLLALTLQAMGVPARSWLGWQLPIRTEEAHARARILDIDTGALLATLNTSSGVAPTEVISADLSSSFGSDKSLIAYLVDANSTVFKANIVSAELVIGP